MAKLFGLVKMKNFANSKNKFGYVYVLTPTGMAKKASITHRFLQRKMNEYEALKAEIEVLKREWPDGGGEHLFQEKANQIRGVSYELQKLSY